MTLVVRLSSLGDVVLASSVTGALGDVVFLTKPRYADLVRRFPGVVEVRTPGDPLPSVDRVVDLQSSPWTWSKWPLASRVDMVRWRRWSRVAFKSPSRIPLVVDRYAEAAGVAVSPRPWLPRGESGSRIGVVPGAAHPTKRWPHWRQLVELLDDTLVFGHPDDALDLPGDSCIEEGFERTLEGLARCRLVVGGDTGLLHLAAAMDVPVVGVFGPTSSRDGFWSHRGVVVERELSCRPCSRHGGERCPIGDHACMSGIGVDEVASAIARV